MKTYAEKLKDPRWQKLRLEIFERDNFTCKLCKRKDRTLNVHHKKYSKSGNPWDTEPKDLITYCEICHKEYENHKKNVIRDLEQIDYGFDADLYPNFGELIYLIRTNPDYIEILHLMIQKIDSDLTEAYSQGYYRGCLDVKKD